MTTRPPLPRQHPDGTTHWTSRSILALIEWTHNELDEIRDQLPALLDKATEWTPSAIPTAQHGDRVNGGQYDEGGNKNGPVPSFVIRKTMHPTQDRITSDILTLIQSIITIQKTIDTITRMMSRLAVVDAETAKAVFTTNHDRPGAGQCANPACGHQCTGDRDDRLIKARCRACYDYRLKRGGERPHAECHPDALGGCHLCQWRAERTLGSWTWR